VSIRREVLSRERDANELCVEVRDMRERMRSELGGRHPGRFDLKQDRGGIVDIEFMVQYKILSGAHERPDLLRYSDNIRHLEGLANAGLMDAADAGLLTEAYKAYRARLHKLTLLEEPGLVDESDFSGYRERVEGIWKKIMGGR
jgi:glutamate-ammonia-ligase adenylyltransferase